MSSQFDRQFNYPWEHFKLHAEQRTKMFHFFITLVGFVIGGFSLLIRNGGTSDHPYAFLLLVVGAVVATVFLILDIRNGHLLQHGLTLLEKLEISHLYPHHTQTARNKWTGGPYSAPIRLGVFIRDKKLKTSPNDTAFKSFLRGSVSHTSGFRTIEMLAIIGFWIGAFVTTPTGLLVADLAPEIWFSDVPIFCIELVGAILCFVWAGWALVSGKFFAKWEAAARMTPI